MEGIVRGFGLVRIGAAQFSRGNVIRQWRWHWKHWNHTRVKHKSGQIDIWCSLILYKLQEPVIGYRMNLFLECNRILWLLFETIILHHEVMKMSHNCKLICVYICRICILSFQTLDCTSKWHKDSPKPLQVPLKCKNLLVIIKQTVKHLVIVKIFHYQPSLPGCQYQGLHCERSWWMLVFLAQQSQVTSR